MLGIVLAELMCMIAVTTVSILHERQARLRALDVVLEGRADSVFGAVQDAEDAGDNVRLDPREMEIPRGDLFAVYDQNGRRLDASSGAPETPLRDDGERGIKVRNQRLVGRNFRVLQRRHLRIIDRAESGGAGLERPVTIVYATPLDHIWEEVFEGIGYYLGVSLLLTLGTTIFMVGVMRRVLRPIEELAAAAAAVSPRELLFEPPVLALRTKELRPLALALMAMMEELRVAFARQHRFLGDAAHELKTAVTVVRSSLQLMLLQRRSVMAYEEGLRAAVQDNARTEELIARMLFLARIEEPRRPRESVADLTSVVQTCIKKLAPLVAQADLHLEQSGDVQRQRKREGAGAGTHEQTAEARLPVPVSPGDLEVLVSNLLVNAIEHSTPGLTIRIETAREEGGAILRVIDEGEGISEDDQEHIFERFYRADRSRTRVTGGAGLGLSITRAIVDSAAGTIAVLSRLGEGTTITVRLPLASQQEFVPEGMTTAREREASASRQLFR